jgi:hypothetical protein
MSAFQPFLSAESALENINAVTEGQMTETLGKQASLSETEKWEVH